MKTSALIILLFAANAAFASNNFITTVPETLDCRDYAMDLSLSPTELVAQDLIHGLWTQIESEGTINMFQFNEAGIVDILRTDAERNTSYNNTLWNVTEYDGQAFLVLTDHDMAHQRLFKVVQNCEGILLTNIANSHQITLLYQPLANPIKVNLVKANLVGDWTSISLSDTRTPLSLRYQMNADGSYARYLGNRRQEMPERGVWEISKDGQFILFHACKRDSPEKCVSTKVASIVYLDDHMLQIEPASNQRDLGQFLRTGNKELSFIK